MAGCKVVRRLGDILGFELVREDKIRVTKQVLVGRYDVLVHV